MAHLLVLVGWLSWAIVPVQAVCHTGGCLQDVAPEQQAQAQNAKQQADEVAHMVLGIGTAGFLCILGGQYWRERQRLPE